jgi:hypothetical protein
VFRAPQVVGHEPHRKLRIAPVQTVDEPGMLSVGPCQDLRRMRDQRDQITHRALGLGHRRHQRGRARGLREPDVEQDVGAPVGREVVQARGHHGNELVQPFDQFRLGALGGQDGDAELDREPRVARIAPALQRVRPGRRARRQRLAHERPSAAPTHRVQVPALDQRGQRLAQRRACDAELLAQLALGRQPRAGRQQAQLDRRPEPLQRLLEGRRRLNRGEDGVGDHSRSNPRTRSQSVTADSNASSSTRALFR